MAAKLEPLDAGYVEFWCPGCNCPHAVRFEGERRPRWEWNGSMDAPTFSPSILVRFSANPNAPEGSKWRTARVCHSFVREGRIQFLSDCTHALAGQTVPLPDRGET
jgi:hypothetical protein